MSVKISTSATKITCRNPDNPDGEPWVVYLDKPEYFVEAVLEATKKIFVGSDNKVRAIRFLRFTLAYDHEYEKPGHDLGLKDAIKIVESL